MKAETGGILESIVEARREDVTRSYGTLSGVDREKLACCARPPRDFVAAVTGGVSVAVIAEVKKASPSAGPIAPCIEASKQALVYESAGAAAVSVLTEPRFFGGSLTDLSDTADAVAIPVLCKDFVVDPVQVFLARGHGADALLLMVSVLGQEVGDYLDLTRTLGMTGLLEVRDAEELDLALRCGAEIVGVNARDLADLSIDLERAAEVVRLAEEAGIAVVAESGVKTREDVERAAEAGANAVLVGETLMRARFPEDIMAELTGVGRKSGSREQG